VDFEFSPAQINPYRKFVPRQPETFLPLVAVTLGDPAGVGPEVVVRTWSAPAVHACCRPLVVGHPEVLCRALARFTPGLRMQTIGGTDEADPSPHLVPCLPVGTDDALLVQPGTVDPRGGQAAYEALVRAARLALAGQVQAICTGPLHKAALWEAGHKYPGHTEILAELCGVRSYAMMLYLGPGPQVAGRAGLGVVHATLHMALRDVFSALCGELIEERIALADAAFAQLLQARPRIGVCALNPHAGEAGLFGREEQETIAPAVAAARARGIDAHGPLPADTLMARGRAGEFDAIVAMYHDQGHIALKLLDMHGAVNVTLGLPIVRTSVAHGTAFDVAWQGVAETRGFLSALSLAGRLAGLQHRPRPNQQRGD
jgi:4-hydroxythreonine-4-phosphate dehydrogenase